MENQLSFLDPSKFPIEQIAKIDREVSANLSGSSKAIDLSIIYNEYMNTQLKLNDYQELIFVLDYDEPPVLNLMPLTQKSILSNEVCILCCSFPRH